MTIDDVLEQLEQEAQAIDSELEREEQMSRLKEMYRNYRGSDRIVTSHELEKMMQEEPKRQTFGSGLTLLDKITGGFMREQLVVISAQEKTGKTAFALQLADAMKQEEPCCFLFEQSPREIIKQMRDRGMDVPYFLTPALNVENRWEWVQERMLEAMVKKGSKVFFIDNVDWLEFSKQGNERTDEMYKRLLLSIKNFCKQWGVTIFLVAHVTKMNFEEIPQPNNIKDTGAFKQIADIVLILWRKTQTEKVEGTKTKAARRTNETLLWVAENRATGQNGYVQLFFDGKKLIERTWDVGLETSMEASEEYEQI